MHVYVVMIVLIDFSDENSTSDPTCCILLPRILCQTRTFSKPQSVDRAKGLICFEALGCVLVTSGLDVKILQKREFFPAELLPYLAFVAHHLHLCNQARMFVESHLAP